MPDLLEIATLHGPARAHLHLRDKRPWRARPRPRRGRRRRRAGPRCAARAGAPRRALASCSSSSRTASPAAARRRRRASSTRRGSRSSRTLRDGELAGLPLVTGGRSSGARVACRTAAATGAVGVLCLAFPVHPPGRPEKSRLDELDAVHGPGARRPGRARPVRDAAAPRRDGRSSGRGRPRPEGRPRCARGGRSARGSETAGYPRRVAIADEQALREVIGQPTELVAGKIADRLNDLTRQFVERSPFVCIATARPDGGLDVSPRGDPAGFVRILDERTLLLPDRPGNKIADTLTNLLVGPASRAALPDPRRR